MSETNGQALPAGLKKIDPARLKLRELAEVEAKVGRRIAGELSSGDLGVDVMQALLWVELRRHDPAVTYEQAGEYDLGTIMDAFADDEAAEVEELGGVDPTRATPNGAATRPASPGGADSKPTPASTVSGG